MRGKAWKGGGISGNDLTILVLVRHSDRIAMGKRKEKRGRKSPKFFHFVRYVIIYSLDIYPSQDRKREERTASGFLWPPADERGGVVCRVHAHP